MTFEAKLADPELLARIEELARKSTEGELTESWTFGGVMCVSAQMPSMQ